MSDLAARRHRRIAAMKLQWCRRRAPGKGSLRGDAPGVKGIGEGGAIAPPDAIANAVNDALRPLGVEVLHSPISPRRLVEAILAARERQRPAA